MPALPRPCLAALVLLLCGCGPAQYQAVLLDFLDGTQGRRFGAWCQERSIQQDTDEVLERYLPPELVAHAWPGGERKPGSTLPESALIQALDQGGLRLTVVLAPAGAGKSRLADALEAELCTTMPALRVEGSAALAARLRGPDAENALLGHLEHGLGLTDKPERQQEFRGLLGKARWVLLVDDVHELAPEDRPLLFRQVKAFRDRYPRHLQTVVFLRPELLQEDPGLGDVEALLEIPLLSCERVQAGVRAALRSDARAQRFWTWAERHGFAAKVAGERCRYERMATWRALHRVLETARAFGLEGDDAAFQAGLAADRDAVAGRYTRTYVDAVARGVQAEPDAVLAVVGAMNQQPTSPAGAFQRATCPGLASPPFAEAACTRLLRTELFTEPDHEGLQRLADPIAARWLTARFWSTPEPAP